MSNNPVVHFEMPYANPERVAKFYADAFGWNMQQTPPEYGGYVMAGTAETDANNMVVGPGINGGFYPNSPDIPGEKVTRVVIGISDIHEAIKNVTAAGGTVIGEPIEIPGIGLWVNFTDSEGNQVGLIQEKK